MNRAFRFYCICGELFNDFGKEKTDSIEALKMLISAIPCIRHKLFYKLLRKVPKIRTLNKPRQLVKKGIKGHPVKHLF